MGGPKVTAPIRRGFGTRLIEASVRGAGGEAKMSVEAGGVRWDIAFPLPGDPSGDDRTIDMTAGQQAPSRAGLAPTFGGRSAKPLQAKRVLVIEDEPLVAMEIVSQLEDVGATVIGPATDAAAALELVDLFRIDAALLDANLHGDAVDDIASALSKARIPFAFVSGYGRGSLPAGFDGVELLPKPFGTGQLLEAAGRLIA